MRKLFLDIVLSVVIASLQPAYAIEKVAPETKEQTILSFAPLVKKSAPAVVNIYTKKKVAVQRMFSPFMNDPIFQHFFGNKIPQGGVTERIESSLGSGVIIKDDGLIVTNNHVIDGSSDITVVLSDRREFEAKIIIKDARTDLAMLKIDLKDEKLPFLELMDSDDLEVGDMVVAIGNPFGVGQTVTTGIVSAVARTTIGVSDYQFFIQTDAAINPGNSGGALINMEGKLAGLNSAIFSKSGGSQGIGFAVPSNMVATIIRSHDGRVIRPWLGVTVQPVTQEVANSIGLKIPTGAIISSVQTGSPAADAGLQVGDIVVAVDGHEIIDDHALNFRIATYEVGGTAIFDVIRSNAHKNISVNMVAPVETIKKDLRAIKGNNPLSGATIGNLSPALADELGLASNIEGVIITATEPGIATSLGFQPRDIIVQINGQEAKTSEQIEEILSHKSNSWKVTVKRGGRMLNVIWNVR
jgi:Do/DeqQ family serine protease